MNISTQCKIELCASQDATRHAISEPYLDITDGRATIVATDGRRCVIIPVEAAPGDVSGFVSGEVLKAARKLAGKCAPASVELNGVAKLTNGATLPRHGDAKPDDQFVNWRQVIPREDKPHKISFNARMLYECAQAMGAENVTLHFGHDTHPIVLTPCSPAPCMEAKAVLMPRRLS